MLTFLFAPLVSCCVSITCDAHGCYGCCFHYLFGVRQRLQQQEGVAGSDGQPGSQSPTRGFLEAFHGEQEVVAPAPEKSDKMLAFELTETLRRKVTRTKYATAVSLALTFWDFICRAVLRHRDDTPWTLREYLLRSTYEIPRTATATSGYWYAQFCGSSVMHLLSAVHLSFPLMPGSRTRIFARKAGASKNGQRKSD